MEFCGENKLQNEFNNSMIALYALWILLISSKFGGGALILNIISF